MYLEDLIEKKWKVNAVNNRGKLYCLMPKINDHFYLHELCKKIDLSSYGKLESTLNIKLLPELKEFYTHYNGCRLFISSVNIFGIPESESFPLDFVTNDFNTHAQYDLSAEESKDIVFFGSVGDFDLSYKQSEINNPKIYLTEKGNKQPVHIFNSIKDVMVYYFKLLYTEYTDDGYRKHPDILFEGTPQLANKFFGYIDWDTDEKKTENEENLCK